MKKTGQVLRIAKFERFGKLDKFEKIWIDLKTLISLEIGFGSWSMTEFTFILVVENYTFQKFYMSTLDEFL